MAVLVLDRRHLLAARPDRLEARPAELPRAVNLQVACQAGKLNGVRGNHEEDEVHTPRPGRLVCADTPEKSRIRVKDTTGLIKGKEQKLNADASEFVPGLPGSGFEFFASIQDILAMYPSKLWIPPILPVPGVEDTPVLDWLDLPPAENAWEMSTDAATLPAWPLSPSDQPSPKVSESEASVARTLNLARCLLDFLLQPAMLQTSHILEVIERRLQIPGTGPWSQKDLESLLFSQADLMQLDTRLAALLQRLPPEALAMLPAHTTFLGWEPNDTGAWRFKAPPELRRLVRRKSETESKSVASLSLSPACIRHHRFTLDRLLRFKRSGIACIQGLDATQSELAASIVGKGYGQCCAKGADGEANTIIWDRRVWTLVGSKECGSAVAVDLSHAGQSMRVVCLRPTLKHCAECSPCCGSHCFYDLLQASRVVVCADLSRVGGTSSAGLVPGLATFQSAMFEILGYEIEVPASGEQRRDLWHPSGVFFRGVEPVAALSGHTEGYLATMSDGEVQANFPHGQSMLMTEFCWN
ncbi:unnamed protein product [Effrenium voratum]|uniref:Uncharacterized protein n=1 Tax=Effrenium voratum TaxID=2562239 RepID=A0AA36I8R6_9DINO|nr:unnamed protein product [Effrenium voratum]CAJ1441807.1 unnamed protein product [Effrenium voratum]